MALAADGRRYRALAIRSPDPEPGGRWGERLAVAGDLDGDGVADLFVGVPCSTVDGHPSAGRVYAVSGRGLADGQADVLWTVEAPSPRRSAGFGFAIAPLRRVGEPGCDLAVGTTDGQEVWLVDGATGRVRLAVSDPGGSGPGSRFGSRLGAAGDLDGDGLSELLVGAPRGDGGRGVAYVLRGTTGELLRELRAPSQDGRRGGTGQFGASVQGVGDADGDGVPDQLVGAPGYHERRGRLYLFSGRTGHLISVLDSPEPQPGAFFGFQDVAPSSPGDTDGDGLAEIYGNAFFHRGPTGPAEGAAWVLDPRLGTARYRLAPPRPVAGGQFGWAMTATDHTGTGGSDLYVGAAPHQPEADGQGGTWVFGGGDGTILAELALPEEWHQPATATNLGPNLGWSVAAPGDLSGSGSPDYVAGAPFTNVDGAPDQGLIFVFCSTPGRRTEGSAPLP